MTITARVAAAALALAILLTGCEAGDPCEQHPNPAKRAVCAQTR